MIGIYREVGKPDHLVRVTKRDDDGITYEDGGKIICTRRVKSFDLRFRKDDSATIAALAADYAVPIR